MLKVTGCNYGKPKWNTRESTGNNIRQAAVKMVEKVKCTPISRGPHIFNSAGCTGSAPRPQGKTCVGAVLKSSLHKCKGGNSSVGRLEVIQTTHGDQGWTNCQKF
jgi:hypothetical protein